MRILEALRELTPLLGKETYAVGGCVRDFLLREDPHDIDIATNQIPGMVMMVLQRAGYSVYATGIDHGTVTVQLKNGEMIEVTTFRKDVSTDGRNATVEFAHTIQEDLSRRDFTINAMAMDAEGTIIDPYNGVQDLQAKKLLRTVGDPYERFAEDYLRIIRAVRFAKRFNLTYAPQLWPAMYELVPMVLEHVSIERVVMEFNKAFKHKNAGMFINDLYWLEFLPRLIPEFEGLHYLTQHPVYHPEGNVLQHVCQVVENAPPRYRPHALLHDIGKKETAEKVSSDNEVGTSYHRFRQHEYFGAELIPALAKRLKLPNDLAEEIEVTTRMHMRPLHIWNNLKVDGLPPKRSIRRFQAECGKHLEAVAAVVRADRTGRLGPTDEFLTALLTPLDQQEIKPILMGRHLIERGWEPGPHFKLLLDTAYEIQLDSGYTDIDYLYEAAYANHF